MDVTDLVRRLLRRRIAVLEVVVIAALGALLAWTHSPVTEESTAAVVIVPPPLGTEVYQQNPLLNLDNTLSQLATVLATAMSSEAVADRLAGDGATAAYSISTVTGTNPSFAQLSPQVVFTVSSSSGPEAVRTAGALVDAAAERLYVIQDASGAPEDSFAKLVTVVDPTPAQGSNGGRVRAAGAVGLALVVLGLLAVLLVDQLLGVRRTLGRMRDGQP